jgi:hypothetical protein
VDEALECGSLFEDDAVIQRATTELHVGEVLEEDVIGLDVRALELLPGQRGAVLTREVIDLVADDDPEVLEAHLVDALVDRRDELDVRTVIPSRTSSGVARTIKEMGRPFQTFSVLAVA